MATQFFGPATISEVALINGTGACWVSVIAHAVDGSFASKQCTATEKGGPSVREIGLWAMENNNQVSLGIDENNNIITFGAFKK